jgi:hypothetical protein
MTKQRSCKFFKKKIPKKCANKITIDDSLTYSERASPRTRAVAP